jgi:hypothetical protein
MPRNALNIHEPTNAPKLLKEASTMKVVLNNPTTQQPNNSTTQQLNISTTQQLNP